MKQIRSALARTASWISGGLTGGIFLSLFGLPVDRSSHVFLIAFIISTVLSIGLAYFVEEIKPEGQDSRLEEIEGKIDDIKDKLEDRNGSDDQSSRSTDGESVDYDAKQKETEPSTEEG